MVVNGRTRHRVDEATARLREEGAGAEVTGVAAHLTDVSEIGRLVAAAPHADVLVSNAGTPEVKPFFEITDDDWLRQFQAKITQQMYEEVRPDGRRAHTVAAIAAEFGVTRPTLGVVTCAVQANGQPVGVVDVDHPAAGGTPDPGVSYAELVEMRGPRLGRRAVGDREAHRVESGVAGRGLRVLPQRYRYTGTGQPPADAAYDAVVVGKLPLDGVAEHPFVPLPAAGQVADRQLDVMDAGERHVCHRYPTVNEIWLRLLETYGQPAT